MHAEFTFSKKAICLVFYGFMELVLASLTPRHPILFCGQIFKTAERTNTYVSLPLLSKKCPKRSTAEKNQLHTNIIFFSKHVVLNSNMISLDCGTSLAQESCKESCKEPRAGRIANFQTWLIDRGVRGIGNSVRIASSGERGYGLFCVRDIQEGEVRADLNQNFTTENGCVPIVANYSCVRFDQHKWYHSSVSY